MLMTGTIVLCKCDMPRIIIHMDEDYIAFRMQMVVISGFIMSSTVSEKLSLDDDVILNSAYDLNNKNENPSGPVVFSFGVQL